MHRIGQHAVTPMGRLRCGLQIYKLFSILTIKTQKKISRTSLGFPPWGNPGFMTPKLPVNPLPTPYQLPTNSHHGRIWWVVGKVKIGCFNFY